MKKLGLCAALFLASGLVYSALNEVHWGEDVGALCFKDVDQEITITIGGDSETQIVFDDNENEIELVHSEPSRSLPGNTDYTFRHEAGNEGRVSIMFGRLSTELPGELFGPEFELEFRADGNCGSSGAYVNSHQTGLVWNPDPENVVASELSGTWKVEPNLTKRLSGSNECWVCDVKFTSDSSVFELLKNKINTDKKYDVFDAGWLVFSDEGDNTYSRHAYLLISYRGNPHVVYFKPRNGDPHGDSESFNVILARSDDSHRDLLFIGGDFNNQSFTALERK